MSKINDKINIIKKNINVKVPESELTNNAYEIEEDKLKRKKVKLYIFKGFSIGEYEKFENYTITMLRLKISFTDNLNKFKPVNLVVRDLLESLDIDSDLFEMFLKRYYSKYTIDRIMGPIKELYRVKPVGSLLKILTLEYHQFEYLVNFLKYLSYEGLKKEELL